MENIKGDYYHPLISSESIHLSYLSYDTPVSGGYLMGATNQVVASGGEIFDISGSRVHVFTTSGDFTVTQGGTVDALVVAGGGGGGNHSGGGAGGVRYAAQLLTNGIIPVTVGLEGAGGSQGVNGQNSTFGSITSAGGGGGGQYSTTGSSGGSGGGGGTNSGSGNIPPTDPPQGFDGGLALDAFTGAGGGGAGSKGQNGLVNRNVPGAGGSGSFYPQFVGTGYGSPSGWFGGGGGGAAYNNGGLGGIGGGGNGDIQGAETTATSGSVNTGGGGGGGYYSTGGSGGSGIVIISYPVVDTGSTLLYTDSTSISGSLNSPITGAFTTGGPLGFITLTRTGSNSLSVWKNRVPQKLNVESGNPLGLNLYLNAANANNISISSSQNNVSYASVGAGLTDDEVYTYYELVDDLQTSLNRGVVDPNAFITVWDTTKAGSASNTIVLPLFGTQAITASWGDGSVSLISSSVQVDRTHSYSTPGVYTVSITGQGQGFQFNNGGDRLKLMDIGQWGSISGSTNFAFYGCTNLVGTAADPHTLQTISLNQYFRKTSKFNGYVNDWDVTRVTDMNSTFLETTNFNQPVDRWRPISCSNFSGMFSFTNRFNQPFNWPFSASNISMASMFGTANGFNQDIGNWDVSRVTAMNYMFYNSAFNNGGSDSIKNWRPISCSNFSGMFRNSLFNQPIGSWPITASNMALMFSSANPFNQNVGSWDVSKVTGSNTDQGFHSTFNNARSFNNGGSDSIKNWRFTTSSTVTMLQMFYNADAFNINIGSWNVEKVTNMSGMFAANGGFNNGGSSDINNWRPISCSNFSSMFQSAGAFNQPIGNWPLSASNIDMSGMFLQASAFNQDISIWDTTNVTKMGSMFRGKSYNFPIENWNVSNVTDMSSMFYDIGSQRPLGSWDVSSVTTMYRMFYNGGFNQNIGAWNVEKVTTMVDMFRLNRFSPGNNFNNGGSPDINNWRPLSCSNFSGMFAATHDFNQPIEGWELATDRSINMTSMFDSARDFNQPLGNWNVSRVTNMTNMFNSSGIDIPNYTKTLRGWGNLANTTGVQTSVPLGATGKKYGAAHAQRKVLTDTYGWTITDGGQEPFVFTINTTASGYNPGTELTFQLPILDANTGSYALDILVNWGDSSLSSISSSTQPEITHTYSNSGSYEITITGSLTGLRFGGEDDRVKLTDVSKWSALEINTNVPFFGCSNLIGSATDAPFISHTDLTGAFRNATNFNGAIGSWDTSNVVIFKNFFENAISFNQDIGSWNTSNATNMEGMFDNATSFNQDIGNWNVSKVTTFTNFLRGKSAEYDPNYMDSIFNNWPNYKLKPNLTSVHFGSINYTSAGVEGKALLERPHITVSINNIQENGGNFQIIGTLIADGLSTGNRVTISGSNYTPLNKAHTITVIDANTFTVPVAYTSSIIPNQGEVIRGYGWTMITGSQLP
jgi:surface protein